MISRIFSEDVTDELIKKWGTKYRWGVDTSYSGGAPFAYVESDFLSAYEPILNGNIRKGQTIAVYAYENSVPVFAIDLYVDDVFECFPDE